MTPDREEKNEVVNTYLDGNGARNHREPTHNALLHDRFSRSYVSFTT